MKEDNQYKAVEVKFTVVVPDNVRNIVDLMCMYTGCGYHTEIKFDAEPKYAIVTPVFPPIACYVEGYTGGNTLAHSPLILGHGDIVIFYPQLDDFIILPPEGGKEEFMHDRMF